MLGAILHAQPTACVHAHMRLRVVCTYCSPPLSIQTDRHRHRHRHTRTWKKALGEMRKLSPRMLSENESSPDTSVTPVSSFALHKRRQQIYTETCKMNQPHMRSRGMCLCLCLPVSSCHRLIFFKYLLPFSLCSWKKSEVSFIAPAATFSAKKT